MSRLTIALAQLRVIPKHKKANLQRALATLEEAKKRGADYVLFPEMFLTGFYIADAIEQLAEPLSGESIRAIQNHAKRLHIGVLLGFAEACADEFYNTAVFIGKNGEIQGVSRKVHLYDKEKEYLQHGTECQVFQTEYGTIGFMISYDMEFPEIPRILATKGAEIIFILASNMVPFQHYQNILLRARAMENHIFAALVNKVGLEEDILFFGESEVISPDGSSLYLGGNDEELGIVTLDLSEIKRIKEQYPFNYMESRRKDIYKANHLV
ncbi:carbon-nitrogen hydrolase family protein [Brevibacillus borstelensis]|uniref:carbon-nitrogen hydrolase family protein n=1 Tax=Brevibacillus borstelensis TaxID=45462 RepID=UPI0030C394FC